MSNIAIEFQNVGKMYRLGRVGTGTLSHDLNRWWQMSVLGKEDPYLKIGQTNDRTTKGDSDYVWALRDISFKVEQGDVVGIIGKNGAGKSTLLKLLSNITSPSTGSIKYHGRIASLLEVGTGFHPEMTARENIYMNGSIMGMTKPEITRKLDEIVDFAGVERYLDTPVKRFSSGMTVRLGFAVAAFLEPEILVVDEVLTVGDAEFQKKAIGKMKDISSGGGRTVLFVSHNMAAIRRLCTRGVLLHNGQMAYEGTVVDTIDHYMDLCIKRFENTTIAELPRTGKGSELFRFINIEFLNENGMQTTPRCGHFLRIRVTVDVKTNLTGCAFSIGVFDSYGAQLISLPSYALNEGMPLLEGICSVDCDIIKLPLTGGSYNIAVWGGVNKEMSEQIDSIIPFNVEDDDFFGRGHSITRGLNGRVVLTDFDWHIA